MIMEPVDTYRGGSVYGDTRTAGLQDFLPRSKTSESSIVDFSSCSM